MTAQYIRGDTAPVIAPILLAQAVAVADMVGLSTAGNVVRAADEVWQTAIATPSAPTVTNTATTLATGMTNALTGVKVSYQFPWGEGPLSAAGTATPTLNAGLLLTGVVLPAPAYALNVYVETAAGSGVYKLYEQYAANPGTLGVGNEVIVGYGVGQAPPTAVASGALELTQYNFAQRFLGMSGQRKDANVARAYGNSTDNVVRVETGGIFQFDTASASYKVGDFIGPAKDTGNALTNNKVAAVAGESNAIAQVVEATTSSTVVKGRILSAKTPLARRGVQ